MTKHQKLNLIRYTRDAIRKLEEALLVSSDRPALQPKERADAETALAEAKENLAMVETMPTSD